MRTRTKLIIASILTFIVCLVAGISIYAYYEYYGQYLTILNVDGTIKLDAFDVLYPDLRNSDSYGKTPDNPYVIDNATRLKNLIKLNNNGKLLKSKEKDGVDKYYFCLQFDCQDIQQVLDLSSEGDFSTIGNNDYPFVDELSGVVYAYELTSGNYVYYSGCLPVIEIYEESSTYKVRYNGIEDDNVYYVSNNILYINGTDGSDGTSTGITISATGTYYLQQYTYDSSSFTATDPSTVVYTSDTAAYSLLDASDTTTIHQMISNETIVADDTQVDVGFISSIGDGGYAHDLILYNETIKCEEEEAGDLLSVFKDVLDNLTGHNQKKANYSDERHIGFFTGHMAAGSNANNISIAGESNFVIDTESVNYFSNFTTVGYIEDSALIGGKLYSEIALDNTTDGEIAGVLWADNIYACDKTGASTGNEGDTEYKLTDVSSGTGWPGTDGQTFTYGSFKFLLSDSNDVVSSIWANSSGLYMLGDTNYTITGSVLYCTDEYRYKDANGINTSNASVKETVYDSISSLDNSGNVIDAGKYIITAKVQIGNDYYYYAVKMYAVEVSGTVYYYIDDRTNYTDVTEFITGSGDLYQSALWEVSEPSSTPTFENSRFEGYYLSINDTEVAYSKSSTEFGANINDSTFYCDITSGDTVTRYYLNYSTDTESFYFSEESNTVIEIYQVTDGYDVTEVEAYSNIVDNGQYLVVAYNNGDYYLLGVNTEDSTVLQSFDVDVLLSAATAYTSGSVLTTTMTTTQYTSYANYIWRLNATSNTISLSDKLSNSFYLYTDGSSLSLSTNQVYWTYTDKDTSSDTAACSLALNGAYLTASGSSSDATNFTVSTSDSTIYLLAITPQDSTPSYITYDGALYVDADASTIEAGKYIIAAEYYGEKYVLGFSDSSTISYTTMYQTTTTYNPLWTYYTRSGSGTESDPYVYTKATSLTRTATTTVYYDANGGTPYTANSTNTITSGYTYYTTYGGTTEASITLASGTYYTLFTNLYTDVIDSRTETTTTYTIVDTVTVTSSVYYSTDGGSTYSSKTTSIPVGATCYTRSGWWNYSYTETNPTLSETYYILSDGDYVEASSTYSSSYIYYTKTTTSVTTYYTEADKYEFNAIDSEDSTLTTTSIPYFKNNMYSKYLYTNGTTLSTNTAGVVWRYNAVNKSIYYISGETFYYLAFNGSSFTISTTESNTYLYQIETEYHYNNLTQISDLTEFNNDYIFVSTMDLTDTSQNSYLVGINDYASLSGMTATNYTSVLSVDYYGMSGTYEYDGNNIITTKDLSSYIWTYSTTYNGYYHIMNYGWEENKTTSGTYLYLACSNALGSRLPVLLYSTSYNTGTSGAITRFTTTDNSSGDMYLGYVGGGNTYYLIKGNTDQSVSTLQVSGTSNPTPTSGTTLYYYYCSSINSCSIATLVSSEGDTLEKNIHYAIAAKSGDSYYAMTYDANDSSAGITGTDMTIQFNTIIAAGASGYNSLSTVPSNCDWEQISNNYQLRFMHYNSSTATDMNYMNFTKSNDIETITSAEAYTDVIPQYYDKINKILSYVYNNTTYYLTYDATSNEFGSSTNQNDAAEIILIRYTPSYKVEKVTSYEELNDSNLIIAGHSVNGYTALGIENGVLATKDVTNCLQSELSEEDYLSLINYLWYQSYTNVSSSSNDMIIENLDSANGISAYRSSGGVTVWDVQAGASIWTVTYDSSSEMWILQYGETPGSSTPYYIDFSANSSASSLTISDTYEMVGYYISSNTASSVSEDDACQVMIYDSSYNLQTSITSGDEYMIFIKSGGYYYIPYLNNGSLANASVGKNLNGLSTKITNLGISNYLLTANAGAYGYTLEFSDSGYYLYTYNSTLYASTSSITWDYEYVADYVNKSHLYTVSSQYTSGAYLGVSGSKVTVDGSATYLYTVSYDSTTGTYSLDDIATSLSSNTSYALVIYNNGYYYIVSTESSTSTKITYNAYGSGLPTVLTQNEIFVGGSSTITKTINSTTYYLRIDNDSSLGLFETSGNASWSYTGSTSSALGTFTSAASNYTYEISLFRVYANDELDNTTDVTVLLNGKVKLDASLSVLNSTDYVIVAEYDGAYYALTMADLDEIKSIDITDTMEEALDGGSIRLYTASVWKQLGSDYSLIFDNECFAGSFYYLLDSSYEAIGSETSPVISTVSLYDSTKSYYTVLATRVSVDSESWDPNEAYYTYVDGDYLKQDSYADNTAYFTLETTAFTGDSFEDNTTYYILSGNDLLAVDYENSTVDVSDNDQYIWRIYTYYSGSTKKYIIGWYSSEYDTTRYLYFNTTTKTFEVTTDFSTATSSPVQIYQLGEEDTSSEVFQTFNIYLEKDNVTIVSFPLTEVEDVNTIETYSSEIYNSVEQENGTVMDVIPGEYLLATKVDDYYYTLTLDSNNNLAYYDVTLIFDGNYIKDTNGYYCVSINTKYIWKQVTAKNSLTINDNYVSGLAFNNYGCSDYSLAYSSVSSFSYDATYHILSCDVSSTTYYLAFTQGSGFYFTTDSSLACDLIIYSVGASAVADSTDQILSYTYYGSDVNSLSYSYFNFAKYNTEDLPNYANAYGYYDYTNGWLLTNDTILSENNASVYFKDGVQTSSYQEVNYSYTYENADYTTTDYTVTYYAPAGVAAFVVTEADAETPVYINVIATTQEASASAVSRYLALWQMSELTYETGVTSLTTSSQYSTLFDSTRYTPYAAVPLANIYDTTTGSSSTSLVKVSDDIYYLSDTSTYDSTVSDVYDHLIAHTFVVTTPGVYYLGATSGSVAFSYISIDRMRTSEQSEDTSTNMSEDFTIDYVWGSIGTTTGGSEYAVSSTDPFTTDTNVSSIAYVGRTDSSDSTNTWFHSNIYPEFINGTQGMIEPESGTTYYTIETEKIARITGFVDGTTYYTYDGSTYTAVSSTDTFNYITNYYTYDGSTYTLVHQGDISTGTYYTLEVFDGVSTFTLATANQANATYYTLTYTAYSSLTAFDASKAYYTYDSTNDIYTLVYNPVDYLELHVARTYTNSVSKIDLRYKTTEEIYNYGYGITYIDSNSSTSKTRSKITTTYVIVEESSYEVTQEWSNS